MKEKKDIERRIEETLNSLEGIRRAEANPFLFTRIQARLGRSRSGFERVAQVAGKPAFAFLLLLLVVGSNVAVMWKGSTEASAVKREQTQFAVADEYHLDVPALYDYETPEP